MEKKITNERIAGPLPQAAPALGFRPAVSIYQRAINEYDSDSWHGGLRAPWLGSGARAVLLPLPLYDIGEAPASERK